MNGSEPVRSAIYSAVGERVRLVRLSRQMTQIALAAAVGLNRTSIVNIERGKQRMLLHTLYELAAALDIAPAELLSPVVTSSIASDFNLESHDPETREFVKSVISSLKPRKTSHE